MKYEREKLKEGRSFIEDELIRRLRTLIKNDPDLKENLKLAKTPKEKMVLCCNALYKKD